MVDVTFISNAMLNLKLLRIKYLSTGDNNPRWRKIEPYSYRYLEDGQLALMGWDVSKPFRQRHIRAYILSKITDVRILPHSFTPRFPIEISMP